MRKIKKKKETAEVTPLLYDQVMQLGQSRAFFRVPACPKCTVQKKYGTFVARGPVFTEQCPHCGEAYICRPGVRSLIFGLITVVLCVLLSRTVMRIADNIVPMFFLTLLPVIGAYFLWPLTLSVQPPKVPKPGKKKKK